MPTRVAWERQNALSYRTSVISASDSATAGLFAVTADGIAAIGPTAAKCGFLLDEKPSIKPGVEVTTVEKSTGLAQAQTGASGIGVELNIARKLPTFSVGAMGMNALKLEILLWSLFQKGSTETDTTWVKNYIPYVQGAVEPEMWLDIATSIGDPASATGYGQLLAGAICTQFSISGSQGERWSVGAEFAGRTYRNDYIHTASDLDSETLADHVFLDYSWAIDDGGSSAAKLQALDLTIANNAVPNYYNELVPTGFTLGRMATTGSFSLAMSTSALGDWNQMDNYVAGQDVKITGTQTDVVFTINARYTDGEADPAETEELLTLPYEGVYNGTNQSIQVDIVTNVLERGIPD